MLTAMAVAILAMGAQADDPLAPSRDGKIACIAPDRAARTCVSTIGYARNADGTYRTTTTIRLASDPLTTIVGHAEVTASPGMVCEVYRSATIDSGQVFVDGAPASAAVAARWHDELKGSLTEFEGRTLCAHYRQDGDLIRTETTVDGEPRPGWGSTLIWVSPDEGYQLR